MTLHWLSTDLERSVTATVLGIIGSSHPRRKTLARMSSPCFVLSREVCSYITDSQWCCARSICNMWSISGYAHQGNSRRLFSEGGRSATIELWSDLVMKSPGCTEVHVTQWYGSWTMSIIWGSQF